MSARLWALYCLLNPVVSSAWTGSNPSTGPDVVVYLKSDSVQPAHPLEHMKLELGALMSVPGYHVEWRDSHSPDRNVDNAELVIVELRGSCGVPPEGLATRRSGRADSLASTHVSGAKVLPFSWVNCDNLTRLLAPSLAGESEAQCDYLYGRAMARLVAHELYHILANTREHGREGIGKAGFTSKDLLSERLGFATPAIALIAKAR